MRPPPGPWAARLLALIGTPVLALGLAEGALRLAGAGYPVSFLLPSRAGGRPTFRENPRFGWRFFPQSLARSPLTLDVPRDKGDAFRVVVVGESAALGDPDESVSFGRMLQVLLEARRPGRRFEVVPAAMTAVNSHVLREAVRDCAALKPDVLVIYMGHNEVVGPFGAGTVFGRTAPLALVRAQVFLKRFRLVQVMDGAAQALARRRAGPWKGMEMFLDRQVPADDPALKRVYSHYERNLDDILDAAHGMGARAVLCTLGSNLRDGGPFASVPPAGDAAAWEARYRRGRDRLAAGDPAGALAALDAAAALDDRHADLAYQRARALMALGRAGDARAAFTRARDLDTLRFRADTALNGLIRRAAERRKVPLADIETAFAQASPHGVPGRELLLEHVHMTFAGNELIARRLEEALAPLLPPPTGPRISPTELARRLSHNAWTERHTYMEIEDRLSRAPFVNQSDHGERLAFVRGRLKELEAAQRPSAVLAALKARAREAPEDAALQTKLAELARERADPEAEVLHRRRLTELHPGRPWLVSALGAALAKRGLLGEAEAAYREALALDPTDPLARHNLGVLLTRAGRDREAFAELSQAVRLNPRAAATRVNLGLLHQKSGDLRAAQAEYAKAVALDPAMPRVRYYMGLCLQKEGRWAEAAARYREETERAPEDLEARYNLGNALERLGRPAEAAEAFQALLRRSPGHPDAARRLARLRDARPPSPPDPGNDGGGNDR